MRWPVWQDGLFGTTSTMTLRPKQLVRKLFNVMGYDVHALPRERPNFRDLNFDLPRLIKSEAPVVIDVGANKGQTIQLVRRHFKNARIYSFEPNPELAAELHRSFSPLGVTVEQSAVGRTDGRVPFNIYESDRLSSVLSISRDEGSPFASMRVTRTIEIPIVRLDTYAASKGIREVDLLYTDAQGFDLEILRGATGLLDRRFVSTIVSDVYFSRYYSNQGDFADLQHFLAEKGYGLVNLYNPDRENTCIRYAIGCFQRFSRH